MRRVWQGLGLALVCVLFGVGASAQQSGASDLTSAAGTVGSSVPRLVRFNGTLQDGTGKPLAGPVDVTFELFTQQSGGEPLWWETQTVQVDAQGRYSVLLGAMHQDGLPMDLFTAGEARWLGVAVGKIEQPRVLLVSVPYAFKAGDADTLGGKPATAFVASDQLKDQVESQVKEQLSNPTVGLRSLEMMVTNPATTPQAITETNPSTFTCSTSGVCVQTTQNGSGGIALRAVTGSPTSTTAIFDNLGGGKILSARTTGYAEKFSVDSSGNVWAAGSILANSFAATSGVAIYGVATAASGGTFGVRGQSASTSGVGVFGYATAPTGATYGLLGSTASTAGTGLSGRATAVTGNTIGIRAVTQSPTSTAAIFDNLGGGKLLSARTTGYAEKFSVDGSGNVTAAGIFTGNGSGLTNVTAAAAATATLADTATNALKLGNVFPSDYAPASGSANYVAKAGDTMTGTLTLPANGLAAGTNQLVLHGGSVGIGTSTPSALLEVNGVIRGGEQIRLGSETGTTDAPSIDIGPAYQGMVVRRINDTDTTAGRKVAVNDAIALERDGSDGGLQIHSLVGAAYEVVACMGITNTGTAVNFYKAWSTTLDEVIQLYDDTDNVHFFHCYLGQPLLNGHTTEVTLARDEGDYFWVGTLISTVDQ
jgi:hypothetical protein